MISEKESLKSAIEFLENKMKDPKVHWKWKARKSKELRELKKRAEGEDIR